MSNPAFRYGRVLREYQACSPLMISDTAYSPDANDTASLLCFTSASASTLTVPPQSTLKLPIGATLVICRYGTGSVTIAAGAGVTILGTPLTISAQYHLVQLIKTADDTWLSFGQLG
jgi:hypothetical protein